MDEGQEAAPQQQQQQHRNQPGKGREGKEKKKGSHRVNHAPRKSSFKHKIKQGRPTKTTETSDGKRKVQIRTEPKIK
jgi:hypothetical protein